MGYAGEAARRIRRQPRSRILLWTFIFFILFFGAPKLRESIQDKNHHPIVFTELDELDVPECSQVPSKELARLQRVRDMTVHTYRGGSLLMENQEINEQGTLCIIAAMPQTPPFVGFFKDQPVVGRGPDNVHLYINSSSVLVTVPPLLPLPSQPSANLQLAGESVLYYAEVKLKDSGVYEVSADRDYENWRWAKQWYTEAGRNLVYFITGETAPINNATGTNMFVEINKVTNDGRPIDPQPVESRNIHPPTITVYGSLHPDLPSTQMKRCSSLPGFSAEHGRWYNATDFPNLPADLADEWGFVYTPDECTLDYFTDLDMVTCLENKVIHIQGDSNGRRLSRAIMSGGRWCHDPTQRCQSEDWGEPVQKVVDFFGGLVEEEENPEHNGQFEMGDRIPFKFGRNTTLSFTFLESIAMSPKSWLSTLYDEKDYKITEIQMNEKIQPFDPFENLMPNAKPRRPPDMPRPDLVVIAFGAWDEAFDSSFAFFDRAVPYFRDALLEAYPDPTETKFAIRISQGVCCRQNFTEDLRRFTGMRTRTFSDSVRDIFGIDNGSALDGRGVVLDASGMSGRPEVVREYGQVGSNHQRAAHVRVEAQILLNRLCERNHEGRAVWKEDVAPASPIA